MTIQALVDAWVGDGPPILTATYRGPYTAAGGHTVANDQVVITVGYRPEAASFLSLLLGAARATPYPQVADAANDLRGQVDAEASGRVTAALRAELVTRIGDIDDARTLRDMLQEMERGQRRVAAASTE